MSQWAGRKRAATQQPRGGWAYAELKQSNVVQYQSLPVTSMNTALWQAPAIACSILVLGHSGWAYWLLAGPPGALSLPATSTAWCNSRIPIYSGGDQVGRARVRSGQPWGRSNVKAHLHLCGYVWHDLCLLSLPMPAASKMAPTAPLMGPSYLAQILSTYNSGSLGAVTGLQSKVSFFSPFNCILPR